MTHVEEHDAVTMGSERSFGLVFAVVFAAIGIWPLVHTGSFRGWALVTAVLFAVIALLVPRLLKPLNKVWFKFGLLLGRIVGPVVMALLFFIAISPTAFIFKLRGKDLLRLKRDSRAKSYWIERDETLSGSMHDQF